MNNDEQSIQLLTALAQRLRSDPEFMAHTLARYQQQQGLDESALAAELGALPEMVLRLALCRRPAPDAPDFAGQVRALADFTLLDEARLTRVIRRVDQWAEAEVPRGFRAKWLAAARAAWAVLVPARVPLWASAAGLIFFAVTGVLLWRTYHQTPAPRIAQQRPQPTVTLAEAAPGSPAPKATAAQSGNNPTTAVPQPEILLVKVDLEDYASLRGPLSGAGVKAIPLPAARVRLLLSLPESSARGWYRVSLMDNSGRTVVAARARSFDGKNLSVPLDLRGLRTARYRLRLTHANEPPADYPAGISRASRRGKQGEVK